MKKVLVILFLLIGMASLFAESVFTQTIVLVSVVEEKKPSFNLDVVNVRNGYVRYSREREVAISALDIKENVRADLVVSQTSSRFKGYVELDITFTELTDGKFHTEGMRISGSLVEREEVSGSLSVCGSDAVIRLHYNHSMESADVAELSVEYNGDPNLPEGEYISLIKMSYVVL